MGLTYLTPRMTSPSRMPGWDRMYWNWLTSPLWQIRTPLGLPVEPTHATSRPTRACEECVKKKRKEKKSRRGHAYRLCR